MRFLVTGTAGFIGNFVAEQLLARGEEVVGLDNVNDYYDPALKEDRLRRIAGNPRFIEARMGLEEKDAVAQLVRPRDLGRPRAGDRAPSPAESSLLTAEKDKRERIEAIHKNGVLTLKLPKAEPAKARRIEVRND